MGGWNRNHPSNHSVIQSVCLSPPLPLARSLEGDRPTYHVMFFSFLISLVAHWLSVFVLDVFDLRP